MILHIEGENGGDVLKKLCSLAGEVTERHREVASRLAPRPENGVHSPSFYSISSRTATYGGGELCLANEI